MHLWGAPVLWLTKAYYEYTLVIGVIGMKWKKKLLISAIVSVSVIFGGYDSFVYKAVSVIWGSKVEAEEVGKDYGEKKFKTWKELFEFLALEIYDTSNRIVAIIDKKVFQDNKISLEELDAVKYKILKEEKGKVYVLFYGTKRVEKNTWSRQWVAKTEEEVRKKEEELAKKEEEVRKKEEEVRKKEEEVRYKERVYLKPSFELEYIIYDMLNDRYKKELNAYMNILKEGIYNGDSKKIKEAANNIIRIIWKVMDRIKKWDKSVYDRNLIDNNFDNDNDINKLKGVLSNMINFYKGQKVFYDSVNNPWLVKKWKDKMHNRVLLLKVIINDLNIKEKEKEEIKKLLNTLWREIDNKPIKPFSEKFKQN